MNPQDAIDLGRDAMKACFMVGGPILLASLVIGLLVSVVQAMTQIQDQTVSFVPKLLAMTLVLGLGLPWLSERMVDFSHEVLAKPMTHYHPATPITRASFIQTNENLTPDSEHTNPVERNANDAQSNGQMKSQSKAQPKKQSPFELPHYRYSKLPKENIKG